MINTNELVQVLSGAEIQDITIKEGDEGSRTAVIIHTNEGTLTIESLAMNGGVGTDVEVVSIYGDEENVSLGNGWGLL